MLYAKALEDSVSDWDYPTRIDSNGRRGSIYFGEKNIMAFDDSICWLSRLEGSGTSTSVSSTLLFRGFLLFYLWFLCRARFFIFWKDIPSVFRFLTIPVFPSIPIRSIHLLSNPMFWILTNSSFFGRVQTLSLMQLLHTCESRMHPATRIDLNETFVVVTSHREYYRHDTHASLKRRFSSVARLYMIVFRALFFSMVDNLIPFVGTFGILR